MGLEYQGPPRPAPPPAAPPRSNREAFCEYCQGFGPLGKCPNCGANNRPYRPDERPRTTVTHTPQRFSPGFGVFFLW
jgi:hypothetical protein